ncbi:MAG: NAD(P)H-binding protein [Holophagaceae bacterium]|nr:NAD(P)H-binding protein [Holophagaceae bacterium]
MIFAKLSPTEKINYSAYPPKQVVVAGATGLVGREIIRALEERPNVTFVALVRRLGTLGDISGRVREVEFDYESPDSFDRIGNDLPCDALICALGTTARDAGSVEAFRMVDLEYPSRLFERLKQLPNKPMIGLVSSVGARKPRGLYLRTKHDVEQALINSGLPHLIVRPSLLLGEREDARPREWLYKALLIPYLALIKGVAPQSRLLWHIAPIEASKVADALVRICVDEPPIKNSKILEGLQLHHPILQ